MTDAMELLVTSDASTNSWSSCVWDYKTGTLLHSYKGGGVVPHNTAQFINNDYFITAECLKPLLHVWPVNSQETIKGMRFVCPGPVRALSISNDGCYCAAAIEEKIHIWQTCTGRLLCVCAQHLQPINKLEFGLTGSYVVSCGEDGLVVVWSLVNLLSDESQSIVGQVDPLYKLSDHSLPVTDIYVGKGGMHAKLATVSADRTLKIYHLLSGNLLLNIIFDKRLTAVTMNASESLVFVGTETGDIYEFNLTVPPTNKEYFVDDKQPVYKSHNKPVTCLSVSIHGLTLVSGSKDEQVILWNISSKQKIRTVPHKGAVTNAFFKLTPRNMFEHDFQPTTPLNVFQRSVSDEDFVMEVINHDPLYLPFAKEKSMKTPRDLQKNDSELLELRQVVESLKMANKNLYEFAIKEIIDGGSKIGKVVVKTNINDVNK